MGIKFECPNGHKLHVKSFLAGKKGLCPECGVKIAIPGDEGSKGDVGEVELATEPVALPDTSHASRIVSPAAATPPPVQLTPPDFQAQDGLWFVRLPSGDQFGPADQAVFDEWVEQGRIGPTSLVWKEGWQAWRNASEVIDKRQSARVAGNGRMPTIANSPPQGNTLPSESMIQIETDRPVARSSSRTPFVVILLCLACVILLIPLVWMLGWR